MLLRASGEHDGLEHDFDIINGQALDRSPLADTALLNEFAESFAQSDGEALGVALGVSLGPPDGADEGLSDGETLGIAVGLPEGANEESAKTVNSVISRFLGKR